MNKISRRDFLRSLTFAGGVLLTGCGSHSIPGARVTLTQWYHQYGEARTQQAALRYALEYTRQRPDVAVRVVWVPGDYGTKLSTALLTPGGPDMFEGQVSAAMVRAGQIAPLDDLLPLSARADLLPQDLAMNTVEGHLYGVKMSDDIGLLYYRKSLFAAAGLEPPSSSAALLAAAKTLTAGDRKGLFIGNDGGLSALLTILPWSAGSDFLEGRRVVFNTPRTLAAYELLRELGASGALLIGSPTDYFDPTAMIQGLSAMQWTGLWAYPALRRHFGEDIGAIPWPALDALGKPATFLGGWSQMVSAQSAHVADAKAYLKWLWVDNVAAQKNWTLDFGLHLPPRSSLILSTPSLRGPVPTIAAHSLRDYGRSLPPDWDQAMTTALTDALTNALKRGQPLPEQLSIAAKKCERELERALE
ncbi:MAG: ABC transporter substrate-binding protein [Janthinobacterium lividum]